MNISSTSDHSSSRVLSLTTVEWGQWVNGGTYHRCGNPVVLLLIPSCYFFRVIWRIDSFQLPVLQSVIFQLGWPPTRILLTHVAIVVVGEGLQSRSGWGNLKISMGRKVPRRAVNTLCWTSKFRHCLGLQHMLYITCKQLRLSIKASSSHWFFKESWTPAVATLRIGEASLKPNLWGKHEAMDAQQQPEVLLQKNLVIRAVWLIYCGTRCFYVVWFTWALT